MKKVTTISGIHQATTPTSPDTDESLLYSKSDNKWYSQDSAGVESILMSSDSLVLNYRATLLGADGSLTSATVAKNELSAAIVWAYSAEGIYTGTLVGAFPADLVTFNVSIGSATGGVIAKIVRTSDDVVTLSTFAADGTTAADFIGTVTVSIVVDA